jgi:CMP-2-keto-3-deoxyoctulosonic acid synthetase
MKTLLYRSLAPALLAATLALNAHAASSIGQVDFGQFSAPGKGEEFVEVRLQSNLLAMAAQLVSKSEPDAAKLLNSVEAVRVNVLGLTSENREELTKRVRKIRDDLSTRGWEQNVNVQGKKGEDVGIFTKTRGTEALAGVVVTVIDDEHVVLVNVVGDIKPDQVAALGESLKIPHLKEVGEAIKK